VPLIAFIDGVSFDPASGEVRRRGHVARLEPQPAALLALLVARAGALVTHSEIARHLWPDGTHVDFQAGVHYAVREIRAALGDQAEAPRFVETMPRRGYRLRADALCQLPPVPAPGAPPRPRRAVALAVAVAAAALIAAGVVVERRPNDHHARAVAVLDALHDLVY